MSVMSKILERCLCDSSMKTLTKYCLDIKWATERHAKLNIHGLQYLKIGRKI